MILTDQEVILLQFVVVALTMLGYIFGVASTIYVFTRKREYTQPSSGME